MSVFEHFIRSGLIAIIVFITNFSAGTAYSQVARQNLQVGKTSIVVNKVTANNRDDARQLSTNDPVYSLERITAGLDSHGEILLNDNTHILVGPGADVSLDDFVISDKGITSATISACHVTTLHWGKVQNSGLFSFEPHDGKRDWGRFHRRGIYRGSPYHPVTGCCILASEI